MKHTPGPWVAYATNEGQFRPSLAVGANNLPMMEDVELVCVVSRLDQLTKKDEANARLIAAAPELLEAVIDLIEEGKRYGFHQVADCRCSYCALVAKAVGNG